MRYIAGFCVISCCPKDAAYLVEALDDAPVRDQVTYTIHRDGLSLAWITMSDKGLCWCARG